MVAREVRSGRTLRLWEDDLRRLDAPPFPVDARAIYLAYYASAEFGCHRALGWPLPELVVDLFAEFRVLTNGRLPLPLGSGLLGALTYFGLDAIGAEEKESMRQLAMRGGPWTEEERVALLEYCESDVDALVRLLPKMIDAGLDLPQAVLRGRSMKAIAAIEHTGLPIDTDTLDRLLGRWDVIKLGLIGRVDAAYGIYEGTTFKQDRFEGYLTRAGIPWPRLTSGAPKLDGKTFRGMARVYPELRDLRELRSTMSELKLAELPVGLDGRHRFSVSAFRAKTGRNQPKTRECILGSAVWVRSLIKPAPGWALAYVDWEQQEFGIAGALSGDAAMQDAYRTGDPYFAFAKVAGAVPADAVVEDHVAVREQYKACAIALLYGMTPYGLAPKIGQPRPYADELIRQHRQVFPTYHAWTQKVLNYAMLHLRIHSTFGWAQHIGGEVNPRSLINFPTQANGAELLRLALCLTTEAGIRVCAPLHDALFVEAPLDEFDEVVARTQELMAEASRVVLDGFELRSEAKLVRYPERFSDPRGQATWETVLELLAEAEEGR